MRACGPSPTPPGVFVPVPVGAVRAPVDAVPVPSGALTAAPAALVPGPSGAVGPAPSGVPVPASRAAVLRAPVGTLVANR